MNKAELVAAVATEAGITQADAHRAINAIQTVIKATVTKGEDVRIAGLFNLKVEQKPARTGRNPSTGAAVDIPAKKAVKIKVAKELADAANGL